MKGIQNKGDGTSINGGMNKEIDEEGASTVKNNDGNEWRGILDLSFSFF